MGFLDRLFGSKQPEPPAGLRYRPTVIRSTRLGSHDVGPFQCTLLGNLECAGGVGYLYLLEVVRKGSKVPCYFVSSEINAMAAAFGAGSHFLCAFQESGHVNFGASNSWGDRRMFLDAALGKVAEHFSVPWTSPLGQPEPPMAAVPLPSSTGKFEIVEKRLTADAILFTLKGPIDLGTFRSFHDPVKAAIDGGAMRMVLDMNAVTYFASTAYGALFGFLETLGGRKGRLVLVHPTGAIPGVPAIMPLEGTFEMQPSVAAALALLGIAGS